MRFPASREGGTLTTQEIEVAHHAEHDLGPGYPQIPLADPLRDLCLSKEIGRTSLAFPPAWTPERQSALDEELALAVASFLSLPPGPHHSVRVTFSGSVALNRALTALINRLRKRGANRIEVITTSPSIDIMRLFLEERSEVDAHFDENRGGRIDAPLDPEPLVEQIRKPTSRSDIGKLVLLTSPENPTGNVWRAAGLKAVANACATHGVPLLVDHSFLVAGIQEWDEVPRIWDVAADGCEWLAVWDTGKTFGLNEDKLGFAIAGHPEVASALDEAIAVMQFGLARRQKLLFAQLLGQPSGKDYVGALREACRTNLRCLQEGVKGKPVAVCPVGAGSFALLDCARLDRSDEQLRLQLLRQGVGVVAGSVFFHGRWRPDHYLRIALAREPSRFAGGVEALVRSLVP
jgi:aspartate/methionine/tyrosine aminotransferase